MSTAEFAWSVSRIAWSILIGLLFALVTVVVSVAADEFWRWIRD